MARYLKIVEGAVVDAQMWDDTPPALDGVTWLESSDGGPGWSYADEALIPPVVVAPVPAEVGSGQLIQALHELNLLAVVDAAVAAADELTRRLWASGRIFPRQDPLVIAIASALGKNDAELDDIFRLAASK